MIVQSKSAYRLSCSRLISMASNTRDYTAITNQVNIILGLLKQRTLIPRSQCNVIYKFTSTPLSEQIPRKYFT